MTDKGRILKKARLCGRRGFDVGVKGDWSRVSDVKAYRGNYDAIWGHKKKRAALAMRQRGAERQNGEGRKR